MSANNITQLCQKSIQAFLFTQNLSFITDNESQILTGIASADMMLPAVVVQCGNAIHSVPYEGNWTATARIEIHSNASDTTQDEHHERAGEVFGLFMTSVADARQNLSSADLGFTAQQVTATQQGWEVNDDSWVSYLMIEVECAGTYFDVS